MTEATPTEATVDDKPRPKRGVITFDKTMEFDFNGLHYVLSEVNPEENQGWSRAETMTRITATKLDTDKGHGWVEARSKGDTAGRSTTITVKVVV